MTENKTTHKDMSTETQNAIEARVLQRLIAHLQRRTDVQNIDLMNLANFCRNCLSNWYKEEAEKHNIELSKDESREIVYGMPYSEWKDKHQTEATAEQLEKFNNREQ